VAIADLLNKKTGNDFEETPDEFPEIDADGPDPKPKRPETKDKPAKPPPPKVPPHQRREVKDKLGAMIEFFALGWETRDPYCGGKLAEQADEITERALAIIVKRPKMLAWFLEGSDWGDWLMLATALQPVTIAIWQHHVTKEAGPAGEELEQYAAPLAA